MALNTETKVGIFFILGLVLLGIITFKVENWSALFVRKNTYYMRVPAVSGLSRGSTVAIAGLKVGEVKDISLEENAVRMMLRIEAQYRVHNDSKATVAWGGLLGNRYIDITLGTTAAGLLPPGSFIPITPSLELGDIFAKIQSAAEQLENLTKGTEFGPKLSRLVDDISRITKDISEQRGTIGKLIGSTELHDKIMAIAEDLKGAADRVNKLVSANDERINSILKDLQAAGPKVGEALDTIKRIGEEVQHGKGILPRLLSDEQMYQDLKGALARVNTALDGVEQAVKQMREGKGVIGQLTNDEQLAAQFKESMQNINKLAAHAAAIAERIDTGDSTIARLTRDKDLYVDVKKVVDDARETLRSAREQIPVGTFASLLLNAF